MEIVESIIEHLGNYVNHMSRILTKLMREMKQGFNPAPAAVYHNTQVNDLNNRNTTITEANNLSGPQKQVPSPGVHRAEVDTLTLKGYCDAIRFLRLLITGEIR